MMDVPSRVEEAATVFVDGLELTAYSSNCSNGCNSEGGNDCCSAQPGSGTHQPPRYSPHWKDGSTNP
jgi:hypothetical protein